MSIAGLPRDPEHGELQMKVASGRCEHYNPARQHGPFRFTEGLMHGAWHHGGKTKSVVVDRYFDGHFGFASDLSRVKRQRERGACVLARLIAVQFHSDLFSHLRSTSFPESLRIPEHPP
jgi:hypothetical protein